MVQNSTSNSVCLKRTRGKIVNLVWAVLFFLVAMAMMAYAVSCWTSDRSHWEFDDWGMAILGTFLGIAALAAGLYESVTAIRDAFFPAKSRLAKSIRSQLPYPDEAPTVKEMFAMVDRDITENGVWFDRVAVGKEWVLGDDATYIPRIRAVFGRDEIHHHMRNGRATTSRVIQIYIIDDRKHVQITGLRNPSELNQLLDCLRLRTPDALFLPYDQYTDYITKSGEAWDAINREYQIGKAKREMDAPEHWPTEEQNMVFTRPDGTDTSRVTEDMVAAALHDAIRSDDEVFFGMSRTVPYESGGNTLSVLQCRVLGVDDPNLDEEDLKDEAEIYLIAGVKPNSGCPSEAGFLLDLCPYDEAERILLDWFRGRAPDVSGWVPIDIRAWEPPQEKPEPHPPRLVLESASGVFQSHESFEREDVEAAADGLRDGTYRLVELTLPDGYLTFRVEPGDKTDGRCTLTATSDEDGSLRFYTMKCLEARAADLLLYYFDGRFRPAKPEWKDITRRIYKQIGV